MLMLLQRHLSQVFYINYENDIMDIYNRRVKVLTIIFSIVMILLAVYIQARFLGNNDRPLTAFLWPICFMLLYAVIPVYKQSSSFGRVVFFLSSISYELYVCQAIAFLLLGEKSQYHPVIYLFCLFILCTIVAYACKYLTNRFLGWAMN